LAQLGSKGLLRPVYVPTVQEEADRQVQRVREQMMRNQRRAKQQIKSFLLQHGLPEPPGLRYWTKASVAALRQLELSEELRFSLEMLLEELAHAQSQVHRATARLAEVARRERHRQAVGILRSAPGVGLITAMTFRTEVPAAERLTDRREVGQLLGLAPQVRSSGERRHECGREPGGNRRLRAVLIEASWRWVAQDAAAQERYRQLLVNTGNRKKAIVGIARRLGILLWRMTTRGEPYRVPQQAAVA
jgi:transposase